MHIMGLTISGIDEVIVDLSWHLGLEIHAISIY